MAYIGQKPADKPLGASDITDGIISNSKLAQDIISAETELAEAPASTDEFLISDGGTLKRLDASYIGGDMTPAFYAELSATQDITDATYEKINFNTEILDTDSAYDNSSNYRFTVPSGEGGKYFIFTGTSLYGSVAYSVYDAYLKVYKNGSHHMTEQHYEHDGSPNGSASFHMGRVMNLSAGDYLEVYLYCDVNGGHVDVQGGTGSSNCTYFGGYKMLV